MINISEIVKSLNELNIDCFLVTDFKGRDSYARKILGLREEQVYSRRWYCLIHRSGSIATVTHQIEPDVLPPSSMSELPISRFYYSSRDELEKSLAAALHNSHTVAMCYSPKAEIPIISTVDAGTAELVRSVGVTLVSAANLLQRCFSKLNQSSYNSHIEAGEKVDQIRKDAFHFIASEAGSITEYDVVGYILNRFDDEGLISDHPPCVAVNENSGFPHYQPTKNGAILIKSGDFVLIDLWAKLKSPEAIYYDITWVGVLRDKPTAEQAKVFSIVQSARDGVVEFIKGRLSNGQAVLGYEADKIARDLISQAGFSANFTHRTGHSINTSVHGEGANLDGYETYDNRELMPWSCFSVEPGIYLRNFGIRCELNLFMLEGSVKVTGEVQDQIVCLG